MLARVLITIVAIVAVIYLSAENVGEALDRGILEHDEGHALLNANTWHHIMKWALGGGLFGGDAAGVAQLRDALHQQGGTLYSAGKFGYSLLVAVVALPFGEVTQAQALVMAAVCGIMVCALAGLLAFQYTDNAAAGAIAAAGCYMSPLLTALSREVSGTIWALMFCLAAACLLHWAANPERGKWFRWGWGMAGGALLGYGFACHFNIAPFILAVFVATGLHASRAYAGVKRAREFFGSLLPAAVGSLGVLAVFEVVTQIVDYRLRDVFPEYLSFFGEHRRLFFRDQVPMLEGVLYGDGAIGWGREAWLVYWDVVKRECLWAPTLLVAMVVAIVLRKRLPAALGCAAVLVFLPLVFWLGYVYRVERVMGMCIAASWVFIAMVAGTFIEKWRERNVTEILVLGFLIVQLSWTQTVIDTQTAVSPLPPVAREALSYIKGSGGVITAGSFDTGFAPLWKWTLVEQLRKPEFAGLRDHVDFSRFAGAEIVFIDPSTWRRDSGEEFTVTREEAVDARLVTEYDSEKPPWTIVVRDLRYPESGAARREGGLEE